MSGSQTTSNVGIFTPYIFLNNLAILHFLEISTLFPALAPQKYALDAFTNKIVA
jgi:hypothetical protein